MKDLQPNEPWCTLPFLRDGPQQAVQQPHYHRPDIFRFQVDTSPRPPVTETRPPGSGQNQRG